MPVSTRRLFLKLGFERFPWDVDSKLTHRKMYKLVVYFIHL